MAQPGFPVATTSGPYQFPSLACLVHARLGLEKHPGKTFVGRIDKGFDFLGYHVSRGELGIAEKTLEKYRELASRLYEQEPGDPLRAFRLGLYARRFARWARGGLGDIPLRDLPDDLNGLRT